MKLLKKLKMSPYEASFLVVFIYPILPLALSAGWIIGLILSKIITDNAAITDFQEFSIMLLALVWFLGGPLGLLGGLMIFLRKHPNNYSRKSIVFFIYGSISYSIIAVPYIFFGVIMFDYWMILHSVYLLFTLWVIGKQLVVLYKSRNHNKQQDILI